MGCAYTAAIACTSGDELASWRWYVFPPCPGPRLYTPSPAHAGDSCGAAFLSWPSAAAALLSRVFCYGLVRASVSSASNKRPPAAHVRSTKGRVAPSPCRARQLCSLLSSLPSADVMNCENRWGSRARCPATSGCDPVTWRPGDAVVNGAEPSRLAFDDPNLLPRGPEERLLPPTEFPLCYGSAEMPENKASYNRNVFLPNALRQPRGTPFRGSLTHPGCFPGDSLYPFTKFPSSSASFLVRS